MVPGLLPNRGWFLRLCSGRVFLRFKDVNDSVAVAEFHDSCVWRLQTVRSGDLLWQMVEGICHILTTCACNSILTRKSVVIPANIHLRHELCTVSRAWLACMGQFMLHCCIKTQQFQEVKYLSGAYRCS